MSLVNFKCAADKELFSSHNCRVNSKLEPRAYKNSKNHFTREKKFSQRKKNHFHLDSRSSLKTFKSLRENQHTLTVAWNLSVQGSIGSTTVDPLPLDQGCTKSTILALYRWIWRTLIQETVENTFVGLATDGAPLRLRPSSRAHVSCKSSFFFSFLCFYE